MDKQQLINSIDQDLIIQLTKQLVAIPTPNPPGDEKPCAEFILTTLQSWEIESHFVFEPEPERPQVVAWLQGSGNGPTLILNAHMDTMGAGDQTAWDYPPFEVTQVDDQLYGRGTCDMKGSLAIGMVILKTLHESGLQFPGTLMLHAPMGEEMEEPGTRTLLAKGYTGDYAIVLEPTDLKIGPASRGACWFNIKLTGPEVHCGLARADAPDVMNAFADVITALHEYHKEIVQITHPLSPSPGCRVTRVETDQAHNSIIGDCKFMIDRRMVPGETIEQLTFELTTILDNVIAEHPQIHYQLEFHEWNEPVQTALDSPLITTLEDNLRSVAGIEPEIWAVPYGCDVRNFIYDKGIPATNFGAGDYRVCHQPNEFVNASDLHTCARVVMGATFDILNCKTN